MDTSTRVESLDRQSLCRLDEIPDGGATAVDASLADGDESLILLRRGDQVRGYLNVCPHAGRRLDYYKGPDGERFDALTMVLSDRIS